ncbi:MAG TPA: thioredoxin family protein [Pirellulales bacterium]|nr:thioredoxin family protein [Pirellulales bacterium]
MSAIRLLIWTALVSLIGLKLALADEALHWETDLPTAQQLAQKSRRLVLIHFGGPWCQPCQRLEHQVFSQPGFGGELTANYVAIKVDPHQDPATAKKYGIEKVPTDVITTARGQLIYKIFPVPASAGAYIEHMNRLASMVQPPAELAAGTAPPTADSGFDRHPPLSAGPSEPAVVAGSPDPAISADRRSPEPVHGMRADASVSAKLEDGSPSAASNPPLALDGFCPVTLVERKKWLSGDARWGAIHRGRTYLFVGQQEQQAFLATPDRYAPVLNGIDPVVALDRQQELMGKREFGAFLDNHIYLFSSEASYRQFKKNPTRYAVVPRQGQRR